MGQTGLTRQTVRRLYRAATVDELLTKIRDVPSRSFRVHVYGGKSPR